MRISPGMLLFGLFDSGVAFFLVYYVVKAKFGGDQKSIARILGALFGTVTFIIYFAVIVWFNTYEYTATDEVKMVVYLAPIVLSILTLVLIQLAKSPKAPPLEEEKEATENEEETTEENEESQE